MIKIKSLELRGLCGKELKTIHYHIRTKLLSQYSDSELLLVSTWEGLTDIVPVFSYDLEWRNPATCKGRIPYPTPDYYELTRPSVEKLIEDYDERSKDRVQRRLLDLERPYKHGELSQRVIGVEVPSE